jgi:hypothetical protein
MTTLLSLKREVEILHKALDVDKEAWRDQAEIVQKTAFYIEKLIEISRLQTVGNGELTDQARAEYDKLNLEIEVFIIAHPPTPDDLIIMRPYKETIEK